MDLVSYCMLLLCGFAFLCMVLSGSKHSHEYYIGIARKIAGTNPILQRSLDNFPAALAPCADKEEFLSTLRCAAQTIAQEEKIISVCQRAGIENPTGLERLMALQIAENQERT
ncbi:hypothetical protein [Janthinobacterium sp. UMAB-56]|uniref:hypothetical protein n=1 Tax=Janthinobacterium sp. UMAB-56 TaxID=1365361 RepID=UPI001C5705D6|nr:hypothetical protein [Janthinobacterium sp. UMAB-56]